MTAAAAGQPRVVAEAGLLDHAWSESPGVDAAVTALVLVASRPSASAPSSGGPIRRRRATCALVAKWRESAGCGETPSPRWLQYSGLGLTVGCSRALEPFRRSGARESCDDCWIVVRQESDHAGRIFEGA